MNAVEFIQYVLQGPLPVIAWYGNVVLIANVVLVNALPYYTNPQEYPLLPLVVGLCVATFILNLYQVLTETPIKNGRFEELDGETATFIDKLAHKCGVTVASKTLVTNMPIINATCARTKWNAQIWISQHWFQSEEGKQHLRTTIGHELGHAFYSDPIRRAVVRSLLSSLITAATFAIYSLTVPNWTLGSYFTAAASLILFTASNYVQAAYTRFTERRADRFAALYASPEAMQETLTFLDAQMPSNVLTKVLPEWKLSTHPKTETRLENLRKNAS